MKSFVVFPDEMLGETGEVLQRKEPFYLHSVLLIVLGVVLCVAAFVAFGKMDNAVRASGVVRPVMNVSTVKSIVSGEIEELFYKPGDFVLTGDKLLSVRGRNVEARKLSLQVQIEENREKVTGLEKIVQAFEKEEETVRDAGKTMTSRYEAFVAEKNLQKAKILRCMELLELERKLPESATTQDEIKQKTYDFQLSQLELEELCSGFISSARQELDGLRVEQENLVQEMTQIQEEMRNLVLVSPVDGYVQEMSSLNTGDYVFADQQVLNIVPATGGVCRVELNIPAEKMGKLEEGQRVKLRFPAFPFSEFRGTEGKLSLIQPDAKSSDGTLFFTAYADVDSMKLYDRKGRAYEIKPGFEVDARIVLERQSLLYFLLKKLDFTV